MKKAGETTPIWSMREPTVRKFLLTIAKLIRMKPLLKIIALILLAFAGVLAEGVTRLQPEPFVFDQEKRLYPITGTPKIVTGKMRIPVILVEFSDVKFDEEHDSLYYDHYLNKENYSEGRFYGSVHDYFADQSNGKLDVSFDILGVVTVEKKYNDCIFSRNPLSDFDEALVEILRDMDENVDFGRYDWNDDRYIDPVGFIVAGNLNGVTKRFDDLVLDGLSTSNYFFVPEKIRMTTSSSGFGTFCHEFSHGIGLPDLYTKNNSYVLDSFDLMDFGTYNDDGYTPVGYSAYEKWLMGWLTPIELTESVTVADMKSQDENGDAYWIVSPYNENEAFFIENRQQRGWDKFIPQSGLMVSHLNYDPGLEYGVMPNAIFPKSRTGLTYVQASGNSAAAKVGALYPYKGNDSLSAYSNPGWKWESVLNSASHYVNGILLNIEQNDDGTMNFRFEVRDNSLLKVDEFDVVLDGIWYRVNRQGLIAQIVKNRDGEYSGDIVIPSTIVVDKESFTVSSIGENAFDDAAITSIALPESIITICKYAFSATDQLNHLDFPRNLKYIGTGAFENSALAEVVLPDGLDSIGKDVFRNAKITRVVGLNGMKKIPEGAFEGANLKEIVLDEGLEEIGVSAFYETNVEEFVIPASVKTLSLSSMFSNNLKTVVVKNSVPIPLEADCIDEEFMDEDFIDEEFCFSVFGGLDDVENVTLRVPEGSLEAYMDAPVWNWFGSIEEYKPDSMEEDSTEEHTTVIAKKMHRYNIRFNDRSFDMKGRLVQNRAKRRGFFVKR